MIITNPLPRHIKSFVRREGRWTPGQRQALELLWEKYVLPNDVGLLNWKTIFSQPTDVDTFLEIGFGMGHSILNMAIAAPEKNFLGIEVFRPGIGSLLAQLNQNNINNVRVLCADAAIALPGCIPEASLAGIHIFFPDPWPKKRHHKRRLIQPAFVSLLASKLKLGGYLHLATDWEDYAQHMLQVLSAIDNLTNATESEQFISRGDRPTTKYERRGERLGHAVRDLMFYKTVG